MQMSLFIYNFVMCSVLIIGFPLFLVLTILLPKWKDSILERFGILNRTLKDKIKNNINLWFHCASIGESKSIISLAKEIQNKYSKYQLVFTTTTWTGKKILKEYFNNSTVFYLPIDIYFFMKPVVDVVKPKVLVVAETEIWPNLFYLTKKNKGNIVVVNGRISRKSFKKYKMVKGILADVLNLVDMFGMRTEEDASFIKELGAEPDKVIITGDLKFESLLINDKKSKEIINLIKPFCYSNIIVFGSVHLSEMKILLDSFKSILDKFKDLTLIIAPRFLDEIPHIEDLLVKYGINYIKRSKIHYNGNIQQGKREKFIIVDTTGELSYIYEIADVAFVGGSLSNIGGHNILEPVFFGKPVLFGPYIQNFNEIAEEMKKNFIGFEVKDKEELINKIIELLSNKDLLVKINTYSKEFIERKRGAVYKNMELIERFLI